ncbi:MAG: fibronectin type III domain-containing protein, partial [Armatimonadetes bacterium]|nr:fibronectin type III domain-containing protein [Armatimonadota bacterium]
TSPGKWGANYFYTSPAVGGKNAKWYPNVITPGNYNVYAWWVAGWNRTTVAPYTVYWNGGSESMTRNQQINGASWQLLKANVPFALGHTGFIRVTNSGIETGWNVMADAIKLEYADTTPPSDPTNLSAMAMSSSQISLSWTASTDNIGVTGYDIYRNASLVNTSPSNSFNDSGLAANTLYSYYVKAYDGQNNRSVNPSNTATRYTLSAVPGSSSVTCDKTVNTWQSTPTFTFTAVGGFGAGSIQYYRYAWTQSSTHSWTGYETQWSSGTLAPQATSNGSWYLHVKGFNAEDIENGSYSYGPYMYDGTAVQLSNLNDGKYTDATGQLSASWNGADPESGVVEYKYAIGTTSGGIEVRDWTTNSTNTSVTTTGLTLAADTKYYFSVKAVNGAGTWTDPLNSDGVTAATVVDTIANALNRDNQKAVMLSGKVVSANFGDFFYICEDEEDQRNSAIRVEGTSAIESDLIDVSGVIQKVNGERRLTDCDVSPESGPGAPDPIFMIGRDVGGADLNDYTPGVTGGRGAYNIGALVTVIGGVQDPGTGYFMLGSGSVPIKVSTLMLTDIPGSGTVLRVTGIVSTEESGGVVTPVIIPRGDSDCPKPWY